MKRFFTLILAGFVGLASAATTTPVQLLSPSGSTAGQAIVSNGPSSAPTWGAVAATALAPVAANTVLGNFTASSAAPIANAAPSCSTANSALKYTSGTGLSCGTTFALTSGNLSQFAATTSAQLLGVISDETGSGSLVFGTSPTLTTPVISSISNTGTLTLPASTDTLVGRATTDTLTNKTLTSPTINGGTLSGTFAGAHTYSGAVTFSNTITPSSTAGIVGTTTNNNANAGSFGEYQTNGASGVSLSTGTAANVTSFSLTAGDWDVDGSCAFVNPGTTVINSAQCGISTTSATFAGDPLITRLSNQGSGFTVAVPAPTQRISIASTTTVYLVVNSSFTTSTLTATGLIRARRVR